MTTIQNRHQAGIWQSNYNSQAPKIGDQAPDFELQDIKGENPLRLSSYQGNKPVVLIFGSFT
jgi:peroxiredoxin